MNHGLTERGFVLYEFDDRYGAPSSLQESSLATEAAVWIGVTENRAHLTQDMVRALLPALTHFVETGRLPRPGGAGDIASSSPADDACTRSAAAHPGLVEWLAGHDRGISSNAMVTRMTGIQASNRGRMYPPSDAPDFGRCFRLLEAVPTLRPLLGEMRDVSTTWARLVDGWDGIEHCYRLDLIEWSICEGRRVNPPPVARTYIEMNRVTGPTASNVTEADHERRLARLELDRGRWERDRPDVVDEALQRVVTP